MREPAGCMDYTLHGALTDPGVHATALARLPKDVPALCQAVQGLLIHEAWLEHYGVDPAAFAGQSRETLPVSQRLAQLLAVDPAPLGLPRPNAAKALATCRDYALLCCAALRQHGVPARVRCGFSRYFASNPYEDHWVCQYWAAREQRWVLFDAQLDPLQCRHLGVDFVPSDLPGDRFVTGVQAWQLCRSGTVAPAQFGHGAVTGLFFVRVNLARDLLALVGRETSAWDSWRAASDLRVDDDDLRLFDGLAAAAATDAAAVLASLALPPWQQEESPAGS